MGLSDEILYFKITTLTWPSPKTPDVAQVPRLTRQYIQEISNERIYWTKMVEKSAQKTNLEKRPLTPAVGFAWRHQMPRDEVVSGGCRRSGVASR